MTKAASLVYCSNHPINSWMDDREWYFKRAVTSDDDL